MNNLLTRKRIRLPEYDYSNEGLYFVTICSKDRKNIFSKLTSVGAGLAPARVMSAPARIKDPSQVKLSVIGNIVDQQWQNIPKTFPHVELDEYVIMPNHIHGILNIHPHDGTSPSPTTLGRIIGSFKSICSVEYLRYIKQYGLNVSGHIWQRSYHEHVIRKDESLQNIREYIINNPLTWDDDLENVDCRSGRGGNYPGGGVNPGRGGNDPGRGKPGPYGMIFAGSGIKW